jgi:hypothetical protein
MRPVKLSWTGNSVPLLHNRFSVSIHTVLIARMLPTVRRCWRMTDLCVLRIFPSFKPCQLPVDGTDCDLCGVDFGMDSQNDTTVISVNGFGEPFYVLRASLRQFRLPDHIRQVHRGCRCSQQGGVLRRQMVCTTMKMATHTICRTLEQQPHHVFFSFLRDSDICPGQYL